MREFLSDFMKLFADSAIVVCLMLSSFLVLINVYHYKEVSISYSRDFASDSQFNKYKQSLKKANDNIKSVNLSKVPVKDHTAANTAKNYFDDCYGVLSKASFNELEKKNSINIKDVYKYNTEMYESINNKCLFSIKYNYESLDKGRSPKKAKFSTISPRIEERRNDIMASSGYMMSEMESNSSYYFMTDLTRNYIYDRNSENIALTIRNYLNLAEGLVEVSNWYVGEFGGGR